MSTFWLLRRRF